MILDKKYFQKRDQKKSMEPHSMETYWLLCAKDTWIPSIKDIYLMWRVHGFMSVEVRG
jgi:hypothetical protein